MNNSFHLKTCSFTFYPDFFGYVEKRLDKKVQVNFKIYDVASWNTITINILPDISTSKTNQRMKLGQLIEYDVGNYVENRTGRLVPGLFCLLKSFK